VDIQFYHNTVVDNVRNVYISTGTILSIKNNIIDAGATAYALYIKNASDIPNIDINYNLYYRSSGDGKPFSINGDTYSMAEWQAMTGAPDANSLNSNPLFVTNYTDLHLSASSPAIDKGVAGLGVTDDIEGTARDANPDMGAYEYA
jgi:Leucine-rich repeat (LRR) protein